MSPQSPKLFANETLYQLSYTPNMINGSYYAVKKVLGKMKGDCLRSESRIAIRNSKFAERKLREWLDGLEREELSPAQPINFCELLDKYRAINAGKSPKTKGNIEWAINTLRKSWKRGFDVRVATILASDMSSWLAGQNNLKPNSYDELSRQLRNIFELALNDRAISVSPYAGITNKRKRITKEPDPIPSPEQFGKIVEAIGHQRFADHAQDSADLAAFLGLAALGQAEARQFQWKDFDFGRPGFSVRWQKTGNYFEVPFYPYLKNFLVDLYERQGRPHGSAKVFRVAKPFGVMVVTPSFLLRINQRRNLFRDEGDLPALTHRSPSRERLPTPGRQDPLCHLRCRGVCESDTTYFQLLNCGCEARAENSTFTPEQLRGDQLIDRVTRGTAFK